MASGHGLFAREEPLLEPSMKIQDSGAEREHLGPETTQEFFFPGCSAHPRLFSEHYLHVQWQMPSPASSHASTSPFLLLVARKKKNHKAFNQNNVRATVL